ncbi:MULTISPECIES: hypothetical protein [unclassified Duganella]|uniref:hypothetical protein n=1 Tax=unclassified Duganella TaxID=2636909 RepID=UPI0006F58977|nr:MULTISPECIES: hypothetical protein [unclassified Duganella]KQV58082.1 hypothetical protein ASD07_26965 [Duganella sp. Root336D2]KRB99069.1 hypothetical protein ASE26_24185 [Duganella sp. Root198D2]
MNIRRVLVILLLLVLPLQATLAATDSCCLKIKVSQLDEHVAAAADAQGTDSACCTQCDFCHHSHAPFVANLADMRQQVESIAPMASTEPPIYSFIPDIPPRPDRLR